MNLKEIIPLVIFAIMAPLQVLADFSFRKGEDITISVLSNEAQVVHTAFDIFISDYKAVFSANTNLGKDAKLLIGTIGNNSNAEQAIDQQSIYELKKHAEAFLILVKNDKLYVLGSDKRGTAYGILELSRQIGVSPWQWWADSAIAKKSSLILKNGFRLFRYPSVAYRGIFINDEDWGLMPWSSKTFEPSKISGQIGPKTHARIFELLLRLRANAFWPAMHEVSVAFYQTPGNKEIADKYGIVVGASHCEPMMRSANTEWKIDGVGNYNYVNNRQNVLNFWQSRVRELKNSDNIYTLGIRGVHDGKMQGANSVQQQFDAITSLFKDQREMIAKNLNPDVTKVPQVFIPYKEVLDVYNMGLKVPEDVTLMWTDDNYGYIRHFPNESESNRPGGNGVYYHISYWGRPHDYLWLATNHPAQIYTQMKMAYDKGAKEMWILNVGDIKPGEYLMELFLDMAWDVNSIEDNKEAIDEHLKSFLSREFGKQHADELLEIMNEYYRLAYIRKPEFMGNTRTEEQDPKFKAISDLSWSEEEINKRIADYDKIAAKVINMSKTIPVERQNTWFELIEYPVRCAAEMNKKILYGQLARHSLAKWSQSDSAFEQIQKLTLKYNTLNNGKWKNMMDSKPRELAVFQKIPEVTSSLGLPKFNTPALILNGKQFSRFEGSKPIAHGLGYESAAVSLKKGSKAFYKFKIRSSDSIIVEISLAPNHPVEGKLIRYEIKFDDEQPEIVDYHTSDRSEEWKINVLTNQAIRTSRFKLRKNNTAHTLSIKALDEGVVLGQIKVWGVNKKL